MAGERYFIGPGLKDKLRDVIYRVDGTPQATSGPTMPYVYSGIDPPASPASVRLAAYPKTATWSVGETKVVALYSYDGFRPVRGDYATARNMCHTFAPHGADGPTPTMTWCVVGQARGGALVAIEGPSSLRRGTYTGAWSIGTTAAVTFSGSTNTISVTNYCVPAENVGVYESPRNVIFDAAMQAAVEIEHSRGALRIGKYTGSSSWTKHTTATIDIWEDGTPPNETSSSATIENVVNHWADVPANKWVGVQRGANGHYYLVVAEC